MSSASGELLCPSPSLTASNQLSAEAAVSKRPVLSSGHKRDTDDGNSSPPLKRIKVSDSPKKSVSFQAEVKVSEGIPSKNSMALQLLLKSPAMSKSTPLSNTTPSKKSPFHRPRPSEASSRKERMSDIAHMLDQATRFADHVKQSQSMRISASTPLLSPKSKSLPRNSDDSPCMPPPGRYLRRNSFVIHRGKGGSLLSGASLGTQNATFAMPPKIPTDSSISDRSGPLGLSKLESRLVLQSAARRTSLTSPSARGKASQSNDYGYA